MAPQPLTPADVEHLRLLALFYRIATWVFGVGSCCGLPHFMIGLLTLTGTMPQSKPNEFPPIMGAMFMFAGLFVMVLSLAVAVFSRFAAKWIEERTHYNHLFAFACLLCIGGMLGVPLGVFSLIVLTRPQVKASFS